MPLAIKELKQALFPSVAIWGLGGSLLLLDSKDITFRKCLSVVHCFTAVYVKELLQGFQFIYIFVVAVRLSIHIMYFTHHSRCHSKVGFLLTHFYKQFCLSERKTHLAIQVIFISLPSSQHLLMLCRATCPNRKTLNPACKCIDCDTTINFTWWTCRGRVVQ